MLLIFSLLAVGSRVLSLERKGFSSQDYRVLKFGCPYINDHYYMSESGSPDAPQYSDLSERITEKLEFQNAQEFRKFRKNVDSIMSEEHARFPFNNVDPYLEMFRKFNPSRPTQMFSQFYSSFVPTYPPSGEDGITALLRVYERLVKLDSRVKKSFILGTIDLDVDMTYRNFLKTYYVKDGRDEHIPPPSFQHEGIVGVIPISVGGDPGVLLLDQKDLKSVTPVIMNNFYHNLTTGRVGYKQRPNYHAVFEYSKGMDYIGIDYYKAKFKSRDLKKRTDILYFGRSLCSFVQTTQKANLLEPIRMISKFSESGLFEASMTSSIEDCTVRLYTDSPADDYNYTSIAKWAKEGNGFSIKLALGEMYKKTMAEDKAKFIRDVGNRLGLKQGKKTGVNQAKAIGGPLRVKLEELAKMCGEFPIFNKDVYKEYLRIHGGNVSQATWMNKFFDKCSSCLK